MAKLLIIEDNKMLQKSYSRMFKDHELEFVASGAAAIDLLSNKEYDLIVSDGDLEGPLTGVDVWKWAKRERSDLLVKFLFCSGSIDVEKFCKQFGIPFCEKGDVAPVQTLVNHMLEVQ